MISVFGVGLFILNRLAKYLTLYNSFNKAEVFIYSVVLGTSTLILPWTFFGANKNTDFFQLYPLIYALLGLIYMGYTLYQKFKYIIFDMDKIIDQTLSREKRFSINPHSVLISLIIMLTSFYTIFHLLLPLRGYDALWMYIPNSLTFYRVNYLPDINPLNFVINFKEPLHTLLFTFSLYTTGYLSIQFIPILYFIGWLVITYDFVLKMWGDKTKALFSVLVFLVLPFTFYLINFWVYYQEIFVGFFYSATLLILFNLTRIESEKETSKRLITFYIILGSLSFALAILAKLSGWVLLFSIILLIPLSKKLRIFQFVTLIIITLFLALKVSFITYLGIGIIIVLIAVALVFFINSYHNDFLQNNSFHLYPLLIIPFGVIIGGFWLFDTLRKYNNYNSGLIDLYIAIPSQEIKTNFSGIGLFNSNFKIESAQGSDFFSIVLFLLVGNMFVLFWVLPKIRSLFDKRTYFFVIWTLSFFVFWLSFHGQTSLRYLSPILVPMVVISAHGTYLLFNDVYHKNNQISVSIIFLISVLAFLSFYFPVPLDTLFLGQKSVSDAFLQSAYFYYSNTLIFFIIALILSLLFYLYKIKSFNTDKMVKLDNKFRHKVIAYIFISIIVLFPFTIPFIVLANSGGNLDDFNSEWNYNQRPAYRDVVDTLLKENSPTSGVIVVNMPGLPIYLNQPTVDFFVQSDLLFPLYSTNISDLLQFIIHPVQYASRYLNLSLEEQFSFSFDYVVVPNFAHLFYKFYLSEYYSKSHFFSLLFNKNLFKVILENDELLVFKRVFQSPFSYTGLINVYFSQTTSNGTKMRLPIFGKVFGNKTFSKLPQLELLTYFPFSHSTVEINSTLYLNLNNRTILLNQTQKLVLSEKDVMHSFRFNMENESGKTKQDISLEKLIIRLLFKGNMSQYSSTLELSTPANHINLNYNELGNVWVISKGKGLLIKP